MSLLLSYLNVATIMGGAIGFCCFLMFLESKTMGNIIIRDGKFAPSNIFSYVTNPFTSKFLWYPALWRANWILMTGAGMGIARTGFHLMFG